MKGVFKTLATVTVYTPYKTNYIHKSMTVHNVWRGKYEVIGFYVNLPIIRVGITNCYSSTNDTLAIIIDIT